MEDEGVGHRDTLAAMTAPAGVATVAERETAAAEVDGSEEEEARAASASDGSGSESDQGEDSDSGKENEGGEGSRGASVAWLPTASPRATRRWAGRMRVPAFQLPGAAAPPPAPKRVRPYGVPSASREEGQKRRRRGERFDRERLELQQGGEGQEAQPRWAWDRRRVGGAAGRVKRNDTSSYYARMITRLEKELAEAQSEESRDWLTKKLGGARAMLAQRLREEGEREGADGADAEVAAAVAATEPTTDTTVRRFAAHSFGLGRLAMEKEARARRAAEAQATVTAAQEPAAAATQEPAAAAAQEPPRSGDGVAAATRARARLRARRRAGRARATVRWPTTGAAGGDRGGEGK